jgi:hypothetical protein
MFSPSTTCPKTECLRSKYGAALKVTCAQETKREKGIRESKADIKNKMSHDMTYKKLTLVGIWTGIRATQHSSSDVLQPIIKLIHKRWTP